MEEGRKWRLSGILYNIDTQEQVAVHMCVILIGSREVTISEENQ